MDSQRQQLDDIYHTHEDDRLKHEYDLAYYKTLFCPESELKESSERLKILRHKYFSW